MNVRAGLTEEQIALYHRNALFQQGVDALNTFVRIYLRGLEAEAKEKYRASIREAAMRERMTLRPADTSRLDLENPCAGCRLDAWRTENDRVQNIIDSVAEHGGSTIGLPERLAALHANPPADDAVHTCGLARLT